MEDIYAKRYNVDIELTQKELQEIVKAKILTLTVYEKTEYKIN